MKLGLIYSGDSFLPSLLFSSWNFASIKSYWRKRKRHQNWFFMFWTDVSFIEGYVFSLKRNIRYLWTQIRWLWALCIHRASFSKIYTLRLFFVWDLGMCQFGTQVCQFGTQASKTMCQMKILCAKFRITIFCLRSKNAFNSFQNERKRWDGKFIYDFVSYNNLS